MIRIIENNSSGKTRKLMVYAKTSGAAFVCSNPERYSEKAISYGILGLTFYSYVDFLTGKIPSNTSVVIDEIENLFKILNNNVLGYNLSID